MSSTLEPDVLVARFDDPEIFFSQQGQPIEKQVEAKRILPTQLEETVVVDVQEQAAAAMAAAITANLIINAALSVAMNASMSMMLALVKQL